ncbi:aldo/keto reductase [Conexibacter sp. JD483]|uniref:aldo/keto reductase n=1 Tax=unclassified Conexibacter TaxID=2627773 RepID=UPI002721B467|nr:MULTISPECIES: aldo/keto reductase [unclassified Conexibacter]MDO8188239.1 aldo/keto reductase [Conexibacter sp. CPCC 205706]MDO8201906.1 aldo/keto reductase [Conexibacter sp. CPCC 205762]MDR9370795.1 aldo/keto reductase [Conexibacter sp. JD483]
MSQIQIPDVTLADGVAIPQFGFGVFQVPPAETVASVATALELGYRHIDTAAIYGNEREVGEAIAASGIPREQLFVTTKLWNADQGYDSALSAFELSAGKLGLDVVDLYLIHWPVPSRDRYVESWRALVRLKEDGRIRSIGVSNFQPPHLRRLFDEVGVVPAINQVELHPYLQQAALRAFHAEHEITTEAWSPLAQGLVLDDPALVAIAAAHGKSAAQVVLRWHLQLGNVVFPKSVTPARIAENLELFDFELSADELASIEQLERAERTGFDPDTMDMA